MEQCNLSRWRVMKRFKIRTAKSSITSCGIEMFVHRELSINVVTSGRHIKRFYYKSNHAIDTQPCAIFFEIIVLAVHFSTSILPISATPSNSPTKSSHLPLSTDGMMAVNHIIMILTKKLTLFFD